MMGQIISVQTRNFSKVRTVKNTTVQALLRVNKMKRLLFLGIMSAVLNVGCAHDAATDVVHQDRLDSVFLARTDVVRLELDDETSPLMQCTFYDGSGYYYFYNRITGYIERFHIDSTVKSPVRIKTPVAPWSMNVVSPDSVYILDLMNRHTITLIDREGSELAVYGIDADSDIMPGAQGQPYVTQDGLLYSSSTTGDFTLAAVDKSEGRVTEKMIPYPDIYRDFYGALLMRIPYTAYNSGNSLVVVGFPADNNIQVLNLNTRQVRVYYAGSKYWDDSLKPLSRGLIGSMTVSNAREIEYFREITSYGNILYDRWRNVYYRIVEKSTPMPGVNLSNKAKKLSVIIMDKNFRIIGESDIEDDIYSVFRYSVFVSQAGLNIQLLTQEDELEFAVYSIKKNDK